jgi:L-asparaginase
MGSSDSKPRVAVIGTGGTIGSDGRHSLDFVEYPDLGRKLDVAELLSRFPEIAAEADAVPVRFRAVGSAAIGPADWLELNSLVHELAAGDPPPRGIVITHGTATLEETAYFLNLTLKVSVPVVLVGAQRPANGLSSDAGLNLLNAIRLAASRDAAGLGVLVLLNDEIQAAREVTKTSTYRLETFRTPDLGMLGYTDADGRVAIYRAPLRRHAPDTVFDVRGLAALPRIDIAYSYAGADGTAIDAFSEAGAQGIVCASLAPGLVTPGEREAQLRARARGILVVQSCRAGSGRVMLRDSLAKAGIVAADNLNPQKARILAMLALTQTSDPVEVQRYFEEY